MENIFKSPVLFSHEGVRFKAAEFESVAICRLRHSHVTYSHVIYGVMWSVGWLNNRFTSWLIYSRGLAPIIVCDNLGAVTVLPASRRS